MRDQVIEIFKDLVSEYGDIQVKGKKTAYTAMNGNMFAFVDAKGVFCLRLGKEDKAAFEDQYQTGDVVQYGSVMRGYVPVPPVLLHDEAAMISLFAKSVANARSLKPKPTKKT